MGEREHQEGRPDYNKRVGALRDQIDGHFEKEGIRFKGSGFSRRQRRRRSLLGITLAAGAISGLVLAANSNGGESASDATNQPRISQQDTRGQGLTYKNASRGPEGAGLIPDNSSLNKK